MKKVILSGVTTILICIFLLFVTAFIPQKTIQKNMEVSAEYFSNHLLFDHVNGFMFLSRQDNYADCILTNIIYHIDQSDLVRSVISAAYYNPDEGAVNADFAYAVNHQVIPNVDYSRYWHGSMVILRPLFCVFDIAGVRLVLGLLILFMTIWFECLLIKNGYRLFGICYAVGLLCVSAWMSAFCIEYAMTFLVMSVELPVLFLVMTKAVKNNKASMKTSGNGTVYTYSGRVDTTLYSVLCCSAIVTAFVDFLTTETVTFTMAYLVYLLFRENQNLLLNFKDEWKKFLKAGIIWGVSYAFMIGVKWILAFFFLGKEALFSALNGAALRIAGDATLGNEKGAPVVSEWERISGALWRNVGCLFPFRDSMSLKGTFVFVICVVIIVFSIWYLFRRKTENCINYVICLLCVIPFARYLILNNHSYIHFAFTYRAMLIVVVSLLFICCRLITLYHKNK